MTEKHIHEFDYGGKKTCPECFEKFDLPIKPIKAMISKNQFRFSIALGFTLGMMAVLIWSFTVFINQSMAQMELEKQIKHDLIQDVKDTCGDIYPEVHASIIGDRMVIECRTE